MNPCEIKISNELHALKAEFNAYKELMNERHARYEERDLANKSRVADAFAAAEKAGTKTDEALSEYKVGANEWRRTVQDLISSGAGRGMGMKELAGWITSGIMLGALLYSTFWGGK